MYTVCTWQEAEVAAIAALERECFADPWTEEALLAQCRRKGHYGLALKKGESLVGFIYGTVLFEDAEIYKVAIKPEFRGQGLGQRLTEAAFAYFRQQNAERVFLEVRAGNLPAKGLYAKNGFTELRVRAKYYADGEDAVEMIKIL